MSGARIAAAPGRCGTDRRSAGAMLCECNVVTCGKAETKASASVSSATRHWPGKNLERQRSRDSQPIISAELQLFIISIV